MTSVQFGETAVELLEQGAGSPLVLVHGSASDRRTWDKQKAAFAPGFRTITYSRRYHWPNPPIPGGVEYDMQTQLEDLATVIKAVGTPRAHLVGHSYGAYLSLLMAMRSPELVGALVLAEPPVIPLFTSFPPKPHEILGLLFRRPRTAVSIIRFAATGLGPATLAARRGQIDKAIAHFGPAVLGQDGFDRLSPRRFEQVRSNISAAEFLSDTFMLPLDPAAVSKIENPVLLLTAEKSPRMLHYLIDRLQELLPSAEHVEIPGASHIMHEDNAEVFNVTVSSFLEKSGWP